MNNKDGTDDEVNIERVQQMILQTIIPCRDIDSPLEVERGVQDLEHGTTKTKEKRTARRKSPPNVFPPKKNKEEVQDLGYDKSARRKFSSSNVFPSKKIKEEVQDLEYDKSARRKFSSSNVFPPKKNKEEVQDLEYDKSARRKFSPPNVFPPKKIKEEVQDLEYDNISPKEEPLFEKEEPDWLTSSSESVAIGNEGIYTDLIPNEGKPTPMQEKLIMLVEQQLPIWDKGCEEYRNRIAKDRAWLVVARSMYEQWETLSKEEQAKKLALLKQKWNHMRDSLQRSMHTKSGIPPDKKKKYVHFEALMFLLNAADKRRTNGNYEDLCEKDDVGEQDTSCNNPGIPDDVPSSKVFGSPSQPSQCQTFKRGPKPTKISPFQASFINSMEPATKSLTTEDADRHYLLSLLPDYKNLSTSKKWEFRKQVAAFFHQVYIASPTTSQHSMQFNYAQQWSGATHMQQCPYVAVTGCASPASNVTSTSVPSPNSMLE